MPAEWEPHEATWLAWPHEKSDWPGKFAPIPWLYGEIVRHLARVERVRILVGRGDAEQARAPHSQEVPRRSGRRRVLPSPDEPELDPRLLPAVRQERDGRSRHHRLALQRLGQVRQLARDDAVPAFIAEQLEAASAVEPGLVLEGGSIDVNGAGKLLTTEECLLVRRAGAQSRALAPRDLEQALRRLSRRDAKSSGWAAASRATTRTATSTTWRASLRRTPW